MLHVQVIEEAENCYICSLDVRQVEARAGMDTVKRLINAGRPDPCDSTKIKL